MDEAVAREPVTMPAETVAEPPLQQPPQAVVHEPAPAPAPVETAPEQPAMQLPTRDPEPLPTIADGLASFNELRAQGVLQLPDLHLDIHVYSGTPTERFVFVNMSKYAENSTLAEGPTVREITPDGVVLDYLGTPFLLPRE
jgi:general secretion pathway protein B